MSNSNQPCSHFDPSEVRASNRYVCEACVAMGDTWVHLRTCQTCGGIHCCDSSKNKHATQHFQETGHPVVISAEPDEYWAWCYQDEVFMKYKP